MVRSGIARMLVALALAVAPGAFAQDYPTKLIKIIVPVPAGGQADVLARIIAEKLQAKWGQPVIVENRSGANGDIGAEAVYRAAPDGYTFLLSPPGPLVINKSLNPKTPYDSDAFVPVSVIASNANVLLVHPKVPANTLQELIAFAKAHPGKLNYASSGIGSTPHLSAELFKSLAGIDIVNVPYKGGPPAFSDLLGGQVDMMFQGLGTALPQIREGKLRALALGSEQRSPLLPDVPTVAEVLPGFVSVSWSGIVAPPKTPLAIASKVSAAIAESLQQPDVAKRLQAMDARDLVTNTPAEMALFMKQERERWGNVIRATGATAE